MSTDNRERSIDEESYKLENKSISHSIVSIINLEPDFKLHQIYSLYFYYGSSIFVYLFY